METASDILDVLRQLAQKLVVCSGETPLETTSATLGEQASSLVNEYPQSILATCLSTVAQDSLACLDSSPREAWALASIAYEMARFSTDTHLQIKTALTLATALNRLGEFRDARSLADSAASQSEQQQDIENVVQSLCEAAWADVFIGDLNDAIAKIHRVRSMTSGPQFLARCDWIEGRVLSEQGQLGEAQVLLEKACNTLRELRLTLSAARCEWDWAMVYARGERRELFSLLERLRRTFETAGCRLEVSLCDWLKAAALIETDQFSQAAEPLLTAKREFASLGAFYFVALCNRDLASVYRQPDQSDDALHLLHQARGYFLSHAIRAQVATCDINLGTIHYASNHYEQAAAFYEEAAEFSKGDGRELRAAFLHINLGLVHIKQGHFSQAFDRLHRALEIARSKNRPLLTSACHHGLAACYRELGQYAQALSHLQQMKEICLEHDKREALAACDIELAQVHLALGDISSAVSCLEQAHSIGEQERLESLVAICNRLLSQSASPTADKSLVLERIASARDHFLKHTQVVDAALCDLTEGELRLHWEEPKPAKMCFQRARKVLGLGFRDQAWRADYGLGRCAAKSGLRQLALKHYLRAIRTISAERSALVTEQLSNDYHARCQSVFDEGLLLALEEDEPESLLQVIEASKARVFLTLLQHRGWKQKRNHSDPFVANLISREKELRYRLNTLRGQIAVQIPKSVGEPFRSETESQSISSVALQELNGLSQSYEAVVTQLRMATAGLAGVSAPAPFDLAKFRHTVSAAMGSNWAALDYYLTDMGLTVVVISPERLEMTHKTISPFDQAMLENCTSTEPDLRELTFRGTLRGRSMSSDGCKSLQNLFRLLIPRDLNAETLIIAPHRSLHNLPFPALILPDRKTYLIEQHAVLYVPSLQALQHLLQSPQRTTLSDPIVMGVSHFGQRASSLSFVPLEVDRVREVFGGRGRYLREDEATRQRLLELNGSGELARAEVVHMSTHAFLDRRSPHQSRVLLYDDELSALDILDLSLQARLVTLSACQTALGERGQGDELLSIAHAFFYAGAQALLATLWLVEDRATVELVERFYRHWAQGENGACALQQAQIEMIHEGHPPYHWAPCILMGNP